MSFHAPCSAPRPRPHAVVLLALAALSVAQPAVAQNAPRAEDPRWAPIHSIFNQGKAEGRYFRINLPRSDLHVKIGEDELSPSFEFTSYLGFAPMGASDVMAMGEVILLQREVPAVLAEARKQGVRVTALHNHLMNETPRIMYLHVMDEGAPAAVAKRLHALFAASATPLTPSAEEPSRADWSAIDAILGKHSEAEGMVAEYVFPRREPITVHGQQLTSSGTLETASEVVFQQLGGGRVANTGELYLRADEVEAVVRALGEHGLNVTALHNHMLDDAPAHFWVHWYATGDGPTLARGVAAALAKINGAQKAVAEP